MGFKEPLHQGQVEVLQWVADGCPEGKWQGHSYKTTANALAGRRLLTISKKGGTWRAELLSAGRYYLEHGDYPPDHWKVRKKAASVRTMASTAPAAPPAQPRPAPPKPRTSRRASADGPKPTAKLVEELLAAGGTLVREVGPDRPSYSQLVGIINRRKLIPDEGQVLLTELGGNRVEIRLASVSDWTTQQPSEIADASRGKRSHPAVAELRSSSMLSGITPASTRARAFRLLNALAVEAKVRGIAVSAVKRDRHGFRQHHGNIRGDLFFKFEHVVCAVDISQHNDRIPHEPTASELEYKRRTGYDYIPAYDYVKSERLKIVAECDSRYSGKRSWSDTKTLALEYRLPDVLQCLIGWEDDAVRRLEQERLATIQRQKREKEEAAKATEAYYEQARVDHLLSTFQLWKLGNELREFLCALEARVALLDGEKRAAAEAWLTWCREYVAARDPLERPISAPDTPPPGYGEVAEFRKKLGFTTAYW